MVLALAARAVQAGDAPPDTGGSLRTSFRVKYVADGAVYLDGGRGAGLAEGSTLYVRDGAPPPAPGTGVEATDPRIVAELVVSAVAEASAVADVRAPKRPLAVGDVAGLAALDVSRIVEQRTSGPGRRYPAVVSFSEGDPLDEEVREEVPHPPLPSVNRFRIRVGLDYSATAARGGSGADGSGLGIVLRPDITRIAGSYWNVHGYWRARDSSGSSGGQQTLQDLLARTYHFGVTYDNPGSPYTAGIGRLYVPWASSLDTIDGGYAGRRFGEHATLGAFAGTIPDPTSYGYAPDRQIAGALLNVEYGSFDATRFTGTAGAGARLSGSQANRTFLFLESSLSYGRLFSVYDTLEIDGGGSGETDAGNGVSRHFLTIRIEPTPRLELDLGHSYFRDVPEFDPQIVGTGLVDRYLFQGLRAGARIEVVPGIWISGALGKSDRTGDETSSWNQSLSLAWGRIPGLGMRAEARYARFQSALGDGSYTSLALSRNLGESFHLELLAGSQSFTAFSHPTHSTFLTASADVLLGSRYFVQGSYTMSRGDLGYDQWTLALGYVFDSRRRR